MHGRARLRGNPGTSRRRVRAGARFFRAFSARRLKYPSKGVSGSTLAPGAAGNFRRKLFRVPTSVNKMDQIGRDPPKSQQRQQRSRDGAGEPDSHDSLMFASPPVLAGSRRILGLGVTYPTGLPHGGELFRECAVGWSTKEWSLKISNAFTSVVSIQPNANVLFFVLNVKK